MTGGTFEQVVDGRIVRRHLSYLRLAGMSWNEIGNAAGLNRSSVHGIHSSNRGVPYSTASRILAVVVPERPTGWMDRAECKRSWVTRTARDVGLEHANELFIARREGGGPGRPDKTFTLLAKRVCAVCEVRAQCLTYALNGDERGVWGGLTDAERRKHQGKDTDR